MENIITKENNFLEKLDSTLFGSASNNNKIITRATDEKFFELQTLTKETLTKIANFMPEVNRATNAFGKTQSQYMDMVMTVSNHSPYRNLRQILAEIERRRSALKENVFKIKKQLVELAEKKELLHKYQVENDDDRKFRILHLQVEIEEIESGIVDARLYIEGALKSILSYENAYNDIMKAYSIQPGWDEKTFEEAEEEHHIKKAFQQAHGDMISTGRVTQGNHEYFWQCGINPQSAFNDLARYINYETEQYNKSAQAGVLSEPQEPKLEITSFIEFLDEMYKKYKGGSRKILESRGINPDGFYDEAVFKDLNSKLD